MKRIYLVFVFLTLFLCGCTGRLSRLGGTLWECRDGGEVIMSLSFDEELFHLTMEGTREVFSGSYHVDGDTLFLSVSSYRRSDGEFYEGGGEFRGRMEGKDLLLSVNGVNYRFVKH